MTLLRRSIFLLAASLSVPAAIMAQGGQMRAPNPLFGGNNIRVAAGTTALVGGSDNWSRGFSIGASWESWDPGSGGDVGRVAAGLGLTWSRLPFSPPHFVEDFNASSGLHTTTASASDANVIDFQLMLRIRGPRLFLLPSALLGIGYYSFRPGDVNFSGPDSTGTARLRTKTGPSAAIGASLDSPYFGTAAVFAEGIFVYGYSSDSQLRVSANTRCGSVGCDTFKSTETATLRGGVRVRVGR
jgi:hypothetical protein